MTKPTHTTTTNISHNTSIVDINKLLDIPNYYVYTITHSAWNFGLDVQFREKSTGEIIEFNISNPNDYPMCIRDEFKKRMPEEFL